MFKSRRIKQGVSREQDAEATKRCFIDNNSAQSIDKLGISSDTWLGELKDFKSVGFSAVGTATQLKEYSIKPKNQKQGPQGQNGL